MQQVEKDNATSGKEKNATGVYCQILKLVRDTGEQYVIDEMPDARQSIEDARYQIGCQIPDARQSMEDARYQIRCQMLV